MIARNMGLAILGVGLALNLAPTSLNAQERPGEETSLYKRLGGYDIIAATVDDFLERYDNDPKLIPFLGGINAAEGARIRQRFVDYICARTGGPCLYLGRDMTATHEGLAITDTQFQLVIQHLDSALGHVGVEKGEKQELLSILTALRSQIVAR
jgi:hemoglobin